MKRRRFQSIALIPDSGYIAICEEGYAWFYFFTNLKWEKFLELPPIEEPPNAGLVTREEYVKDYDRRHGTDMAKLPAGFFDPTLGQPWPEDQASDCPATSSEPIAYQGLEPQDLPIRDWANLAGKVDRAERLLVKSIDETDINTGCVLRSLIEDIRNELGLPKPGEAAK
jgi:hypothetical protein